MTSLDLIPDRMRNCQHYPSPSVHRIGLDRGQTADASRCLRCGLWLAVKPHPDPADAGVCS